jgi:hypothetical protein
LGEQFNSTGQVGVGQTSIHAALDVNGGVRIGSDVTCAAANAGEVIYTSGNVEYCNGSIWITLAGASTTLTGVDVLLLAGSAAAPSLTFQADTTTGLYQSTVDNLFVTTGGTERAVFDSSGNFDITNGSNTSAGVYQINGTTILALPDTDATSIAVGTSALSSQSSSSLYNTAVGYDALLHNTTGADSTAVGFHTLSQSTVGPNTAFGYSAGVYITTGSDNITIGASAMVGASANPLTAANAGNIAIGDYALESITGAATSNVAIGYDALNQSTVNSTAPNTAIGYEALQYATTGTNNTAIGNLAMQGTSGNGLTGDYNTALGDSALAAIQTSASLNTAVGWAALSSSTVGTSSTAVGVIALNKATGSPNTALGSAAGKNITTATDNIAIGYEAMVGTSANPLTGTSASSYLTGNVAVGDNALTAITGNAVGNTAVGYDALTSSTINSTNPNTAIGMNAMEYATTGTNNTALGNLAMQGTAAHPMTGTGGNVAIGDSALTSISGSAADSTAIGYLALTKATAGPNTAVGYNAGKYITSGTYNIAIGTNAMTSTNANPLTGASAGNIAIGDNALTSITATDAESIAIGYDALNKSTGIGPYPNTAIGMKAMQWATTGTNNTAIGNLAMQGVSTTPQTGAGYNVAVGDSALAAIQGGTNNNVAVGYQALNQNTTGSANVAMGTVALQSNTTGGGNTALGYGALKANTTGSSNAAVGQYALLYSTGGPNTALGIEAGGSIVTGTNNTAIGTHAMGQSICDMALCDAQGNYNTAVGDSSLYQVQGAGGADNTTLGYESGYAITTSTDNTLIGYESGLGVTGSYNIILGEDPSSAITTGSSNILVGNSLTGLTAASNYQLNIGNVITGTGLGTPSSSMVTAAGSLTVTTGLIASLIYPPSDSTTAIEIDKANGSTGVLDIDTTNGRLGIGTTAPGALLDIGKAGTTLGTMRIESSASGYVGFQASSSATTSITYTLPTAAPGTTGYVLSSDTSGNLSWANPNGDITDATIDLANGSAAAPSLSFNSDTTTGLYYYGAHEIGFATNGALAGYFDASGDFDIVGKYEIGNNAVLKLPNSNADTTSIAVGASALAAQSATGYNTALGDLALTTITTGTESTAVGYSALEQTTGSPNEALGYEAGYYISTGSDNIAIGAAAMTGTSAHPLTAATAGNIAIGDNALQAITGAATSNVAIGYNALTKSTVNSTNPNTGVGTYALAYASTGTNNTALGNLAMQGTSANPLTGDYNTAIGDSALTAITTAAASNTAIGYDAGATITSGTDNVFIGASAAANAAADTNEIVIGEGITGGGSNTINLGGIIKSTGDGTPSSSMVTAAGSLTVTTGLIASLMYPPSDSTTAIEIDKANGSTGVLDIDTTNGRVGIGNTAPGALLDIGKAGTTLGTMRIESSASGYVGFQASSSATTSITYTLPAAAPGTTGYVLSSDTSGNLSWANPNGDITDATIDLANGSAAAPSLSFNSDTTTGLYYYGAHEIGFATNGALAGYFDASGDFDIVGKYEIGNNAVLYLPDADTTSIAVGESALASQSATSEYNTALGDLALNAITTGTESTAVGYSALYKATGSPNEALGYQAGEYVTTGSDNIAIGAAAMASISAHPLTATNAGNIAIGDNALTAITGAATSNVAIGYNALTSSTINSTNPNTAVGTYALAYATTGTNNTALGNLAMEGNSAHELTGDYNTAIGDSALTAITTAADDNTALGYKAGTAVTSGADNTLVGYESGYGVSTGTHNIIVGEDPSSAITTGNSNILVGNSLTGLTAASNYQLNIGNVITGIGLGTPSSSMVTAAGNLTVTTGLIASLMYPPSDSTTALQIDKANGSTGVLDIDTTNGRVGIGNTAPGALLDIGTATSTRGTIRLEGSTSGYTQIQPNVTAGSWVMTLPANAGTSGYALTTDGSGNTSWTAAAAPNLNNVDVQLAAGSAAAPSLSFNSDTTTGLYEASSASHTINFASNGAEIAAFDSTGDFNLTNAGGTSAGGYQINGNTIMALPVSGTDTSSVAIGTNADPVQSGVGYYNVAVGHDALKVDSTGINNTGIGAYALYDITTAQGNTAVGYQSLTYATSSYNTAVGMGAIGEAAETGADNTATGYYAMQANTSGTNNTALGYEALYSNTSGASNVAVGEVALNDNTSGSDNVAIGIDALYSNATSSNNTAIGTNALDQATAGPNTALGSSAGFYVSTGTDNIAIGYDAMVGTSANPLTGTIAANLGGNIAIGDNALTAITGNADGNVAIGYNALTKSTVNSTNPNTGVGFDAMEYATSGTNNTALGNNAMLGASASPLTGDYNVALGDSALYKIEGGANNNIAIGYYAMGGQYAGSAATGEYNVAIGSNALNNITGGNDNTAVGYQAGAAITSGNNATAFGTNALYSLSTASGDTAIGFSALEQTTANPNTALGYEAGYYITSGTDNIAIGYQAMQGTSAHPVTGTDNTAIGDYALTAISAGGTDNTVLGYSAGTAVTSGTDNTLVGYESGKGVSTGTYNIIVGEDPSSAITTGSSNILIGNSLTGLTNTSSNQLDIGNTIYGNLSTGYVGIGTTTPAALLHVAGEVIIGNTGLACSATTAGAQRYDSVNNLVDYCNGTSWVALSQAAGPLAFSFTNQTGVNLSTTITSNTVTLTGFIGSLTATCSGCTAIAHNGVWGGTTVTGFATGDTIAIQVLSSASYGTAVTATATVGGTTSGTWTVTTTSTGPSAFSFTNVTGATTGITYTSNTVTLAGGFAGSLTATCSNCTGIALNGVWGVSPMTGFVNGSTIAIRQTSSSGAGVAVTATATVGTTTSGTWSVTTATACSVGITVGQACPDGTIYAGTSPDGSVPMYTTVCDSNQYWNGSACTACASGQWSGSGSTCNTTYSRAWNNGTSNWTVTGYTSATTGKANTAGLVALIDAGSPYNAADYCTSLSAYGHADFYLPAENELAVLYANKAAIANFDTTDGSSSVGGFYPGLYWTSTEYSNFSAWYQRFSDGSQNGFNKFNLLAVRCVRR